MKKRLLITGLALCVLLLAVGGWTVRGIRWTLGGGARLRAAAA
jgi:hypothetical protein